MAAEIPEDIDRRIDAVSRNDVDEAESIARALVYAIGYCPSGVAHYLLMLQDDDADLRGRLSGMTIETPAGESVPR